MLKPSNVFDSVTSESCWSFLLGPVGAVGVSKLTGHMLACNPQINLVWSFFFFFQTASGCKIFTIKLHLGATSKRDYHTECECLTSMRYFFSATFLHWSWDLLSHIIPFHGSFSCMCEKKNQHTNYAPPPHLQFSLTCHAGPSVECSARLQKFLAHHIWGFLMTTSYLFLAEVLQAVSVSSHILQRHGGALQKRRNDAGSALLAVGGGLLLRQRAGRDRHGAVPRRELCPCVFVAGMHFV